MVAVETKPSFPRIDIKQPTEYHAGYNPLSQTTTAMGKVDMCITLKSLHIVHASLWFGKIIFICILQGYIIVTLAITVLVQVKYCQTSNIRHSNTNT